MDRMKIKVLKPSQLPSDWKGSVLGFDIETEDKYLDSDICLVSLYKPGSGFSVVVPVKAYVGGKLNLMPSEELDIFKDFLKTIKVVGHYLQFDLSRIKYHWGVQIPVVFDTFIFARMMQMEKQGLKDIFKRIKPELAHEINKFEDVVGDKAPFYYLIDRQEVKIYSALDAVMPFHIIKHYNNTIKKMKKTVDIEMQYLEKAIEQACNGLRFDTDKFQGLFAKYTDRVMGMQQELNEFAGFSCRCNSTADLTKLLVYQMGMTSSITTPTGAVSMNEESRAQMMDNCKDPKGREILQLVDDLKHEFSVLNSTKKIPNFIIDGRITFSVEQIGYDGTARVYTKDTSVNQIPKEIREAIIPEEGRKFVMFDWSSAELYIAAYWAKCKKIIDWYQSGVDLHTEISKEFLGLDNVTKEQRNISKVVSFATIYGSEGAAVGRRLNIPLDEAKDLVADYMKTFPEIAQLRAKIVSLAHKNYCTKTVYGRMRRLPEINSDNQFVREKCERQAFNTAIQASCADFFKKAAVKANKFRDEGVEYKFGVFDSHLLEVPEEMPLERCREIAAEMSDFSEDFPGFFFRFDIAEGHNWAECQSQL